MSKKTMGKLFVATFVIMFFILFFVTASFSYLVYPDTWYLELLTKQFYYLPILFYLFIIAGIVAAIVAVYGYLFIQKRSKRLLKVLEEISSGNYSVDIYHALLENETYSTATIQAVEKNLEHIQQKLQDLSREVQKSSNLPKYVDGQTKEEILEQERHRLARELHDSVSQQLFAAMMMLSALNQQLTNADEVTRKQMDMIEKIINEAQSEMRALLLHLRPVNLEGKTLKQGIEQLLKELSTKIQIELTWSIADIKLAKGIEDHLFRIVQELLSNTLRHAKANELEVYLDEVDQTLSLRVVDDGVGFDPDKKTAGSYGLQNIRERVIGMGGACKIISFAGKGASIDIKIPVIKESEINDD